MAKEKRKYRLTELQKELVAQNLRLVEGRIHAFQKKITPEMYEELVFNCRVSLCIAAAKFDETKAKFSTYGTNGVIHGIRNTYRSWDKRIKTCQMPDDHIDKKTPDPWSSSEHREKQEQRSKLVDRMVEFLGERNGMVFKMKYLGNQTSKSIAEEIGITTQGVHYILLKAVDKVKKQFRQEAEALL